MLSKSPLSTGPKGRADGANDGGDAGGGGTLVGGDDCHGVRLARGDIHLRDAEAEEKDGDGELDGGHEGDEHEQDI